MVKYPELEQIGDKVRFRNEVKMLKIGMKNIKD